MLTKLLNGVRGQLQRLEESNEHAGDALRSLRRARWRREGRITAPATVDVIPGRVRRRLVGSPPQTVTAVAGVGGTWDISTPIGHEALFALATDRYGDRDSAVGASAADSLPGVDVAELDRLATALRSGDLAATGQAPEWEPLEVAVDHRGRVLLVRGLHRLAVATALGTETLPARVLARHEDWVAMTEEIRGFVRRGRGEAYQPMDHPDLADVPSAKGNERLPMILSNLPPAPATVLDIGCNWGYMVIELSRAGYQCVGVERAEHNARFASHLVAADDLDAAIVNASINDLDLEAFDVVLALSVFHHFLKAADTTAALVTLLGRIDASMMIFEPHHHNDKGMRDVVWNPQPDEFAAWVAEHAGMEVQGVIGTAGDGRDLFVLRRRLAAA